ncbi:glutaredoxin domain-containing protein [Actinoplanes sp. NPDC049681]|uniref:glutaredoxin domain-containing protein n=1 Tax=Actinoplanes sp. NPDC049681 TaxID=3363905 RepID=UPI003798AEEF
MLRRWLPAGVLLATGIALAFAEGPLPLVVLAVLAVAVSPLAFPRSIPAAEAQRRSAGDGKPIIYWRPGCPFCLRLRATVGLRARRAHWVDIWRDPEGAAAVRAVAGGNETVPTVILAGEPLVNPDPRRIRAAL